MFVSRGTGQIRPVVVDGQAVVMIRSVSGIYFLVLSGEFLSVGSFRWMANASAPVSRESSP